MSGEREPLIEFKDFSFRYRSQKEPTLKDINLSIYQGEKILIAGQSGSGKSTLAHLLNALIPSSYSGELTGELKVAGQIPEKAGVFGMSKIVGTLLQDTDGQFIALTVGEDIAFALENDMTPQDEMFRKVKEVAKKLELSPFLNNAPGELSGGQKQRVSLAGIMVGTSNILLFDEPLANLDPATGKNTIALIDELKKDDDLTVIIIEHRLEDVLYRDVDRIILMDSGRIVTDMDPNELLSTDLLPQNGIREPLYIAALKAAGAKILPTTCPQHIESMDLSPYRDKVLEYYKKVPHPDKKQSDEKVLSVSGLSFGYDKKKKIIDDVSFDIYRGEMVALVCKNGAGKSTLASLICGFYKPDAGSIMLLGEDIAPLSIKERGEKIGFVMQSPNQMISKPMIKDEVGLGLTVRGIPEDEVTKKTEDVLKICGLYPYRNWPVSALSFGQKKRLCIASILIMKPDILILDEPTAGSDYRHYTEIMEFIKHIRDDLGITIIMITHDMHLMLEYTDRALVLTDGKLIMDDTPTKVLTDEDICNRAYLKRTSLYDLSVKCGIDSPDEFAARFIDDERKRKLIGYNS